MYYTYIIYSASHDVYYKGYTTDVSRRLSQHNNNESRYTSNRGPWILKFVQKFESSQLAKQREKQLKRQNRQYIEWCFEQPYNIVDQYND